MDRLAPTKRPAERPMGYHRWHELLFVHWRMPARAIAPLLPAGLSLDTWEGDAWVGLVPFTMSGVRPRWAPALPGISAFHETNVRTYVHYRGRDPGVWFFSLDASRSLPVQIARRRWHLNYQWAAMRIERQGDRLLYESRRLWPDSPGANLHLEAEINPASIPPGAERLDDQTWQAVPDTLEHFLVERYILYAQAPNGRLFAGRVHHAPYPLKCARVLSVQESLLAANGILATTTPCHCVYSPGVSVEVFRLAQVAD